MISQWIVGLEPDGQHDGPLHFAVSMHRRGRPEPVVTGVHVLPGEDLVGAEEQARLAARAGPACRAALVRTDAREMLTNVASIEAKSVEVGLERALAEHGAQVCVVGRRAHRRDVRLQRLGPVARHMLRRLPTSMVVVPPDWIAVHDGPVVLATDLTASSAGAAVFARGIAEMLRTPLHLVHVSRHGDWAGPHFEGRVFQATLARIREVATEELGRWAQDHELTDATKIVHLGDPVSDIAGFASREQASLIVCGSRRLGPVARLFGHSVASELAAVADVPVAVVPGPAAVA